MAYSMDGDKIDRLARSIEYSRRKMQPFREKRLEAIKQYVGGNYGEYGPYDRVQATGCSPCTTGDSDQPEPQGQACC